LKIAAVGKALPPHYYDQDTLLEALKRRWDLRYFNPERLERLHKNVLVGGRHLALPIEEYDTLTTWGRANDAWIRVAQEVGAAAVLDALRQGGLSVDDAVPATLLTEMLGAAAAPDHSNVDPQRTIALRPLLVGLPVAGASGTLADRYHGLAAGGRGWVRAKTGTLTGVNSLAGTVLDAEGRILVFALLSNGPNPVSVRPRLDALAAGLRSCGCH